MTLLELKERIQAFSSAQDAFPAVENLYDKLIQAYSKAVGVELTTALKDQDSDEAALDVLKGYLASHWKKINGSVLSYTAMPNADVTRLLCAVAFWVSEQENKARTESTTSASSAAASAAGATPTEKVPSTPLQVLMPGIQVESFHSKAGSDHPLFPHLGPLEDGGVEGIDLIKFLNTYIVSADTPISVLSVLGVKPGEGSPSLASIYSCYDPDYGTITDDEAHRIWTHSALLQALSDAINHYKELSGDKSTLLGQLQELTRLLRFNDAHAGIGTQADAGTGAYAAIVHFNDYYQKLSDEQKTSIHENVKEAVERLLGLSSDTSRTRSAVDIMDTCIGTRREKIEKAMDGQEAVLAAISLGKATRAELVHRALKHVNRLKEQLKADMMANRYQGQDTLPLSKALLDAYGVEIKIESMRDLQALMKLNEADLERVCADEAIKAQALTPIENLEALVIFCIDNPPGKLAIFFNALDEAVKTKFLCMFDGLLRLFISLPEEKVKAITQALKAQLSPVCINLFKQHKDCHDITPSQYRGFLDGCRAANRDGITTCLELQAELAFAPETEQLSLIREINDRLPILVQNNHRFIRICQELKSEAQIALIAGLKDYFPDLVRNKCSFLNICQVLTKDAKDDFIKTMKAHLPDLAQSGYDFVDICRVLTEDAQLELTTTLKDRLPGWLTNISASIDIFRGLKTKAQVTLITDLKNQDIWPDLVENAHDFNRIYQVLTEEAKAEFIDVFKENPALITDFYMFKAICRVLRKEAKAEFTHNVKDRLIDFVQSRRHFIRICRELKSEAQVELITALKEEARLSAVLYNRTDLIDICSEPFLKPEALQALWSALPKEALVKLIRGEAWCLTTSFKTCFVRFLDNIPNKRLEALAPYMAFYFYDSARQAGTKFKGIIAALPKDKQAYFSLGPEKSRVMLSKKLEGVLEKLPSSEEVLIKPSRSRLLFFTGRSSSISEKRRALQHWVAYLKGTDDPPAKHEQAVLKSDSELRRLLNAYQEISGESFDSVLNKASTPESVLRTM